MTRDVGEEAAKGEIAEIYAEVRATYGVAYVSSIHRILALRPAFLGWAWEVVAPAFREGYPQEAAAAVADSITVPTLEPIPGCVRAVWGLDETDHQRIVDVCQSFVRVAPINMMFAGLIARALSDPVAVESGSGHRVGATRAWSPPDPLTRPLVAMVDMEDATPGLRDSLGLLATPLDGAPFVPGLYRMLANWPTLLGHLAIRLPARLSQDDVTDAYDLIRARIDAAVEGLAERVSPTAIGRPLPSADDKAWFTTVTSTYRQTSPEMIVAGRMILDAVSDRPPRQS